MTTMTPTTAVAAIPFFSWNIIFTAFAEQYLNNPAQYSGLTSLVKMLLVSDVESDRIEAGNNAE